MKNIFALVIILNIVIMLCGCGDKDINSSDLTASGSSSSITSSEEMDDVIENEDEETELDLAGDGDYVVVAPATSKIEITSTDDFVNYSVGYIDECDSAVYAEFYDFKSIGMYNASNDAHSGMNGGTVDLIIIERMSVGSNDKIVWDFATNK